jgi:hypothetical protein
LSAADGSYEQIFGAKQQVLHGDQSDQEAKGADNGDVKMKSKLMLLATAAMLVATNAQAGFLSPESQRCTSNRQYGIYKPGSTRQGNCDVVASRADSKRPVVQTARAGRQAARPVPAPEGSLIGVPNDTLSPLVQKEIDAVIQLKAEAHGLPPAEFDHPYPGPVKINFVKSLEEIKAACKRPDASACQHRSQPGCVITMLEHDVLRAKGGDPDTTLRHEVGHCNGWNHFQLPRITWDPQLLQFLPKDFFKQVRAVAAFYRLARVEPSYVHPPQAGFKVLADRLRCLASQQTTTVNRVAVCTIEEDAGV